MKEQTMLYASKCDLFYKGKKLIYLHDEASATDFVVDRYFHVYIEHRRATPKLVRLFSLSRDLLQFIDANIIEDADTSADIALAYDPND